MAKIIHLQYREITQNISTHEEMSHNINDWAHDMKNLLQLIEQSLENTPINDAKYATKDINSRG